MTFLESGLIEIITGVNLPMVIKLAGQQQEEPLNCSGGQGARSRAEEYLSCQ
jgi:mannose/fructose-specific phosphotransferase system component IIA